MENGMRTVDIKVVAKSENPDLTGFSLLRKTEIVEHWVPTSELEHYKWALDIE